MRNTATPATLLTPPADLPDTVGALRTGGHVHRSVKDELRQNLLALMAEGGAPAERFPGIVGFDDTVLPELERALLAGHDLVLLGERVRARPG